VVDEHHRPVPAVGGGAHGARRTPNHRSAGGWSLVEVTVTSIIIAILAAAAVPRFDCAFEQSRADLAATTLRAVWTAQRLYWLRNRQYATSIGDLQNSGVLDQSIGSESPYYTYEITAADSTSFEAQAVRVNTTRWLGNLAITEAGTVSGEIQNGGTVIQPAPYG